MRRPSHPSLCLCAIAVFVLAVGCEKSSAPATAADVLRRGNGGEPVTLDPALAEDDHAFRILADLYEGLLTTDPQGALVAGAAESWEVSEDGLHYTFRIRDNSRWSNGAPVTAHHFIAAIRKVLSPGTRSPYAFLLAPIQNAQAVQSATVSVEELGVIAVDTHTLRIELAARAPHFLRVLAMAVTLPRYPDIQNEDEGAGSGRAIISNGPYMLERWALEEHIRLRKNPHYHDADSVQIEVVDYLPIVSAEAEYRRYRAGEIDITASIPGNAMADIRASRPGELVVTPRLALYYLAFDMTEPPFDNRDLRQALTMAVDREALVDVLGRGEQPAYGLVPPGIAGYDNPGFAWRNDEPADRIEEARAYYARAGFTARNPLEAELLYDAGGVHETIALAITAMWRDVFGADVKLRKMEWQQFLATREIRAEWQVMRFAWTGDYVDPKTFTDLFRSDSPQNLPAFDDDTYDALLHEADAQNAAAARFRLLHDAESQLLSAYPIAPLYFYVSKHLVNPRVKGFQPNLLDQHPTRYLSLDAPR